MTLPEVKALIAKDLGNPSPKIVETMYLELDHAGFIEYDEETAWTLLPVPLIEWSRMLMKLIDSL